MTSEDAVSRIGPRGGFGDGATRFSGSAPRQEDRPPTGRATEHPAESAPRAIGLVRRDVPGNGTDLHTLAGRHGYRLVFTVIADTGPVVTGLVVAHNLCEFAAEAVVVPGFEHAESIRSLITDLAVLITPMRVYPWGHRWPAAGLESRS